jgi:hypothetical protein
LSFRIIINHFAGAQSLQNLGLWDVPLGQPLQSVFAPLKPLLPKCLSHSLSVKCLGHTVILHSRPWPLQMKRNGVTEKRGIGRTTGRVRTFDRASASLETVGTASPCSIRLRDFGSATLDTLVHFVLFTPISILEYDHLNGLRWGKRGKGVRANRRSELP